MSITCKASTFADLADLAAYKKAKANGLSEKEALAKGDNGIGCWGDNTAQVVVAMVAIPPEDMVRIFGGVLRAKHKHVNIIRIDGKGVKHECLAIIADIMPHLKRALAQNGCEIDCNPATVEQLHLSGGDTVTWSPA